MVYDITKPVQTELDRALENVYDSYQVGFDIICSRLNAKVFTAKFNDPDISGMVKLEKDGNFSIYLNCKHSVNRQRFTLAHELGHIISYNAGSYSKEKLATEGFIERKTLTKITDIAETEANELAAQILMPAAFLESFITKSKNPSIETLAKEFGVSEAAMSVRLNHLGYMLQ